MCYFTEQHKNWRDDYNPASYFIINSNLRTLIASGFLAFDYIFLDCFTFNCVIWHNIISEEAVVSALLGIYWIVKFLIILRNCFFFIIQKFFFWGGDVFHFLDIFVWPKFCVQWHRFFKFSVKEIGITICIA